MPCIDINLKSAQPRSYRFISKANRVLTYGANSTTLYTYSAHLYGHVSRCVYIRIHTRANFMRIIGGSSRFSWYIAPIRCRLCATNYFISPRTLSRNSAPSSGKGEKIEFLISIYKLKSHITYNCTNTFTKHVHSITLQCLSNARYTRVNTLVARKRVF